MPVDVLRCRVCESEYPAEANGICVRCFGPLEPVYDWDEIARVVDARVGSRPGRARSGATARCCRPSRRRTRRAGRASRRSCRRRGSRRALGVGEVLLKLDLANPTHSFKDRVVAVAAAKAREFGLETLSATSTGNLANAVAARAAATGHARRDLLPGRARAREARGDDGLRRDGLRRPRQLRRLLAPRQRARRRGRVGDRQREPALLLRRGLEDARVRDLRAARLGDARRGRDADRLRRDVHEGLARLRAVRAARPDRRRAAEALRRPGRGLRAGRVRVRRGPARVAGAAARRSPRRSRSATRPTATSRSRRPRASGGAHLRGARGRDRREHLAARRDRRASSARARPASRSARCARPCARGELGEQRPRRRARHRHRPEDAAARPRRAAGSSRSTPTSTRCSTSWE